VSPLPIGIDAPGGNYNVSSPNGTKFAHKKLDSRPSHGENPESISHLDLNRYYRVVTDRHTDPQNYDS